MIAENLLAIVSFSYTNLFIEMDTTVLSDQDFLNNIPDLDRMDIEESSFLKNNSFFALPPPKQESSQHSAETHSRPQDSALLEEH